MDKVIASITVAPDGFLWFRGAKLQVRLVNGGLEFFEKDKHRAETCGGPLIVVPFEAIVGLIKLSNEKDGER